MGDLVESLLGLFFKGQHFDIFGLLDYILASTFPRMVLNHCVKIDLIELL